MGLCIMPSVQPCPSRLLMQHATACAGVVTQFYEKPSGKQLESMAHASRNATPEAPYEASMGIYVFNRDVLVSLLDSTAVTSEDLEVHFGQDIIPKALREDFRVVSYHFGEYFRVLPLAPAQLAPCTHGACNRTDRVGEQAGLSDRPHALLQEL